VAINDADPQPHQAPHPPNSSHNGLKTPSGPPPPPSSHTPTPLADAPAADAPGPNTLYATASRESSKPSRRADLASEYASPDLIAKRFALRHSRALHSSTKATLRRSRRGGPTPPACPLRVAQDEYWSPCPDELSSDHRDSKSLGLPLRFPNAGSDLGCVPTRTRSRPSAKQWPSNVSGSPAPDALNAATAPERARPVVRRGGAFVGLDD
jgi:hypothetical protein